MASDRDFRCCPLFVRGFYLLFVHGRMCCLCRACGGSGVHPGTGLVCAVCLGTRVENYTPEFDVFRN